MNIRHTFSKPYSELVIETIFKREDVKVNIIQLRKEGEIKKHQSLKPAFLLVLKGSVQFHYEGECLDLKERDYHSIRPNENHWLLAEEDSTLLLLK